MFPPGIVWIKLPSQRDETEIEEYDKERDTKGFTNKVSFPLVGNPSEERLRTSRSDKQGYHTYVLLSNWLEKEGYKVLRLWDNDALLNTREILEGIKEQCSEHPPLHPLPSREGKNRERCLPSMRGCEETTGISEEPSKVFPPKGEGA